MYRGHVNCTALHYTRRALDLATMCDTLISIRWDSVGHSSFRRAPPPWLIVQYPAILQSGNGNLGKGEYGFNIHMHFKG